MPTPNVPDREPIWWISEYTVIWREVEPTFKTEFDQRFREQEKQQGPDNSVFGNTGAPRNVDVEHANRVPDEDWETGLSWDDARAGLRFGVGARASTRITRVGQMSSRHCCAMTGKTYQPSLWQRVKRAVRRGFEHKGPAE